jgi:hypothetical protein
VKLGIQSGEPVRATRCADVERLFVLYTCNEAAPSERAAVEQHVGECTECAALFSIELRLRQMIATMPQPADGFDISGALLEQCRSELAEALDEGHNFAAARAQGRSDGFFARCFAWCRMELAMHPALGAVLFVFVGLGMGRMLPATPNNGQTAAGLMPVSMTVTPPMSDQELQNVSTITGIVPVTNADTGTQTIELHLRTMKPLVINDDSDVTRVLSFVIQNSQRFDSDIRLDSVDVLRSHIEDADVRRVLCVTSRHDANPGVRLRALESLRGYEQDAAVRETMLDALLHDSNPGIRNEAVNEIRALVFAGNPGNDPRVAQVLRELSEHDANNYIRLQAAAAVRQLSAGPSQR